MDKWDKRFMELSFMIAKWSSVVTGKEETLAR